MKSWWLLPLLTVSALQDVPCDLCRDAVGLIQDLVTKNQLMIDVVEDVIIEVCGMSMNKTVCAGAVREMGNIVIDSLSAHYIGPDLLCRKAGLCSSPEFITANLTQWLESVLANKPNLSPPVITNKTTFQFGHITDLHIDLEYLIGAPTDCDLPICCRAGYPGNGTAGHWGDYNCDLPIWTLNAGLASLTDQDLDFIVMTGDYAPHDIWAQSKEYQLSYINATNQLVRKYFKGPLYPTLGNHECFPVNVFNMGEEQWLTDYIAQLWGGWMGSETIVSLKATGSYSVLHKNTNLRIISLNTNACNNQNWWLFGNVTDPGGVISWLHQELQKAENNKEVVYIIGHIAPGMGTCLDEWAYHYAGLIDRYQYIIRGQFFGHSHQDEFQISRGVFSNEPLSVQWVAPSYTTETDINPSYRVVEADVHTKLLVNYYQYRLDLPQANLHPQTTPQWNLAYDLISEYNLPDLYATTIDQWVNDLEENEDGMVLFLNNLQTGVLPAVQSCDAECRKNEACNLRYGVQAEVNRCQNTTYALSDRITRYLMGPWVYEVFT